MIISQITHLICMFFDAYLLFLLFGNFFEKKPMERHIIHTVYFSYVFLCALSTFFSTSNLIIFLIEVLLCFFISFLYRASLSKRFAITTLICSIKGILRLLVTYLIGPISTPPAAISSVLINLMVVLLLCSLHDIKKGQRIPPIYWISIICIPSCTIFLLLCALPNLMSGQRLYVFAASTAALLINFLVFYMYNHSAQLSYLEVENHLMHQQRDFYKKQLAVYQDVRLRESSLRHDLRNHLAALSTLISVKDFDAAQLRIERIIGESQSPANISSTGNLTLDSLINCKLSSLHGSNICLDYKAELGGKLAIDDFDLIVILGNLLDNALEALGKSSASEKQLSVHFLCKGNRLSIRIENTFDGSISLDSSGLPLTKKNPAEHGIGLKNVKAISEKYNGVLKFSCNGKTFLAEVLLYL